MPQTRIPVDVCSVNEDNQSLHENFKNDADSERSSSPKSDGSVSDISDTSETSLSIEFSDNTSEGAPQADLLADEFDALKIKEEQAEALTKQGADMRHVLCTSWKLQSKYPVGKINNKSTSLNRNAPGQALRDMAQAQKLSIEEHEIAARLFSSHKVGTPPGFESFYGVNVDDKEPEPILVSYADGSNSLSLSEKPLCVHNITVSCAVDSCHVFIQQMKNPTYEGLAPLEQAMMEAFEEEAPPPLLRPIATGSLLAVFSDEKWYRCQVVSFDEEKDCCDVKFVDHGGYTTVDVSELRPLRSDFVRLPFQAIEVYIAHIRPADDEIVIDIAADVLFRDDVSIQHLGFAEDGVPVIQAYFYQGDYINLFTQEILDDCRHVFLRAHPNYEPAPITHETSETESVEDEETSEPEVYITGAESSPETGYASDEGVWSPEPIEQEVVVYSQDVSSCSESEYAPVSPAPSSECSQEAAAWVPVAQPMVAYYVPDPNTGVLYYVAAPIVPAPVYVIPGNVQMTDHLPVEEQYVEAEEVEPELEKPFEEWSQEDYERYYNIE